MDGDERDRPALRGRAAKRGSGYLSYFLTNVEGRISAANRLRNPLGGSRLAVLNRASIRPRAGGSDGAGTTSLRACRGGRRSRRLRRGPVWSLAFFLLVVRDCRSGRRSRRPRRALAWSPASFSPRGQGLPFGSSDEPFPARTAVFACMSPPWLRVRRSGRSSIPGRRGPPSSSAWRPPLRACRRGRSCRPVPRRASSSPASGSPFDGWLLRRRMIRPAEAELRGGLTPPGRSAAPHRACGRPRAPGCRRGSTGAPWVPACARAPSLSPTGGPAAAAR